MAYRTALGVMVCVCGALLSHCASGGGSDTVCGNNRCETGEDSFTCPADCSSICGNGSCESTETTTLCPGDCYCGNGTCDNGESAALCPADCGATCGNGTCETGETNASCPQDCTATCGNGTCDTGETATSCPQDCATGTCGDGTCDAGETNASCPQDCPAASCGDGTCDVGETASNCPADCGTCGNGTCDAGENSTNCPADCTGCQDTVCDLYPQCGCNTGQKCSLDTANARTCVTAGSTAAAGTCTADTDCAAGTICLGRSDTLGQCLGYCNATSDCTSGAGAYCTELVDSTQNPIPGAAVCTISCSPNNPSSACGSSFGCEIYQDSVTQALFTDCHGNVGTAQKGAACDETLEQYCAPGLFCNSNLCYKWCVNSSECDTLETCDTAAFSTTLTIGTITYGVCL